MGSLTYDKGAVHLLQAMPRVWEACADAVVVFAGEAPKPGGFEAAFRRIPADRQSQVKRLGVIAGKTKHSLLAATTVFAMPSRVDSFGIVYLEAWAHRKPVIGADAGGVPDVIADGEDGMIIPFGDVGALANAISHLLKNPAERGAMGARGEQKVTRSYTWDGRYEALSHLYSQLHARAANRASVPA
jgi:glycosyltransferase involved in cell wall biosynthesis